MNRSKCVPSWETPWYLPLSSSSLSPHLIWDLPLTPCNLYVLSSHFYHVYSQIDSTSPIFWAGCMEISSVVLVQHLSLFHPWRLPTQSWICQRESGKPTQLLLFPCSVEVAIVLHSGKQWGKWLEHPAKTGMMPQITKGWATQLQQTGRIWAVKPGEEGWFKKTVLRQGILNTKPVIYLTNTLLRSHRNQIATSKIVKLQAHCTETTCYK